ncbi:hypothetical protein SUGI_0532190 [Cryptomeria japonica]|uniref:ribosomal RNA-processing protein 17 n=1 Tax=Cryptomeria japonica TaxID=3369 RepID=UPI002408C8BF|nr:ribosomal RNA-processing protein 17 [Cryptomeria japonica]GLJ27145.1 hypothetical protein SUGI_0532190 [Cryptomeria japonica]
MEEGEQEKQLGRHISKRALRNKSLIISFDENDRREFVTGFHKRKKQRRKLAEKQQESKKREKRLAERKKRRLAIKMAYGEASELPEENPDTMLAGEISEDEEEDKNSYDVSTVNGTLTYEDGETTTIVETKEVYPEKNDCEMPHLNSFRNSKGKVKIQIAKKKSFKKVKKGKKHKKGKMFKKDASSRMRKKGKHKQ